MWLPAHHPCPHDGDLSAPRCCGNIRIYRHYVGTYTLFHTYPFDILLCCFNFTETATFLKSHLRVSYL